MEQKSDLFNHKVLTYEKNKKLEHSRISNAINIGEPYKKFQ